MESWRRLQGRPLPCSAVRRYSSWKGSDSASDRKPEPPTKCWDYHVQADPGLPPVSSWPCWPPQAPNRRRPARVARGSRLLRLHYAVSLIGLPLGTASVIGTVGPASYRLEANGKLTGLAGVIVNSKGAATSTGSLAGGQVNPATFAATAATSNYLLTIRMAMAGGTAEKVEITPPYPQRPDRVALTDADRRGIVDPLELLRHAGSGHRRPCRSGGMQSHPADVRWRRAGSTLPWRTPASGRSKGRAIRARLRSVRRATGRSRVIGRIVRPPSS